MTYKVKRISGKEKIEQCNPFQISHYMWDSKIEPKAYGWMGYIDGEGLFVKMVCEEKNPKREFKNPGDPVCEDSAMEVFLAFLKDGETLSNDCMYTNFEVNANGAMLANFGEGREDREFISDDDYARSGVHAVMEEDKWYFEVLFPESYLNEICDFEEVKKGTPFYCNFYKIAESEEILHFGAYSLIESEIPNFHLPIYFAQAMIEKK